jgi:outer membrane receptor for Fe3+-dicitrate
MYVTLFVTDQQKALASIRARSDSKNALTVTALDPDGQQGIAAADTQNAGLSKRWNVWRDEVQPHFSEKELADLTLAVATINAWNRLSIAGRLVPGSYQPAPSEA